MDAPTDTPPNACMYMDQVENRFKNSKTATNIFPWVYTVKYSKKGLRY